MENLNNKVTNDELTAAEFVQPMSELQNVIEQSGQTLSAGDVAQVQKALSYFVAGGGYYNAVYDGSGDITVTAPTGFSVLFALSDGMRIRFYAAVAGSVSTAPDLTIGAFTRPLRARDGGNLQTGAVGADIYVEAQYSLAADEWRTLDAEAGTNLGSVVAATGLDVESVAPLGGQGARAMTVTAYKHGRKRGVNRTDTTVTGHGGGATVETPLSGLSVTLNSSGGSGGFYRVNYRLASTGVNGNVGKPLELKLDFGVLAASLHGFATVRCAVNFAGPSTDSSLEERVVELNSGAGAYKPTIYSDEGLGGNRVWDISVEVKSTGLSTGLVMVNGDGSDGTQYAGGTVVAELFT